MNLLEKPIVSVVVCAFNEEKLLRSCLMGLVAQSYPKNLYEVLVIDDQSTDRTFAITADFIRGLGENATRMQLFRIPHGGLSVARNAGIQLSLGDIIAFIDGDAVPDPLWIDELVKVFVKGADYVGGRIKLLNTNSWVAKFLQSARYRQFFGPQIFNDHFIGCNMAIKRGVFKAMGGFHENFESRGDESTFRARIRGRFQYAPAPDAVVFHDRPETFEAYLGLAWKSATLVHLVSRCSGEGTRWRSSLHILQQSLPLLVLMWAAWYEPSFVWVPSLFIALVVIEHCYVRPVSRMILMGQIEEYGFVRGMLGHTLFCFLQYLVETFGRIVSVWMHRRDKIIPPMTSKLTILETVERGS